MVSRIRLCFPAALGGWARVYYMYAVPARGEAFSFFFKTRATQEVAGFAKSLAHGLAAVVVRRFAPGTHSDMLVGLSRKLSRARER